MTVATQRPYESEVRAFRAPPSARICDRCPRDRAETMVPPHGVLIDGVWLEAWKTQRRAVAAIVDPPDAGILERELWRLALGTRASSLVDLNPLPTVRGRHLIDAFATTGTLRRAVGVRGESNVATAAARRLGELYVGLSVDVRPLDDPGAIPAFGDGTRTVVAWLGAGIGVLHVGQRASALDRLRAELRDGDVLLLGVDHVQCPDDAVAAARLLEVPLGALDHARIDALDRRLGRDEAPALRHMVRWSPEHGRLDARIVTDEATLVVPLRGHVGHDEARHMLHASGFRVSECLTDRVDSCGISRSVIVARAG